MRFPQILGKDAAGLLLLVGLPLSALAGDVLSMSGFTNCAANASVIVNRSSLSFDRSTGVVVFSVSATSTVQQKVKAALLVTAYGKQVYEKNFDPCDDSTKVDQLCPIPAGTFSAAGSQVIPAQYLSQIPAITFTVPDLDGTATLRLTSMKDGKEMACVRSGVTNGKTFEVPAVSYVSAGVAAAALALTGLSAVGSAGAVGTSASAVGFATVVGWFQAMALNGALSVNYPPLYRSFTKNFAFSTGLIPWNQLQIAIDNFRNNTGGNLQTDNVHYLENATLAFGDGSSTDTSFSTRSLDHMGDGIILRMRDISASINGTRIGNGTDSSVPAGSGTVFTVSGLKAFAAKLTIPPGNVFLTILLFTTIILAAITLGILLFKVILEAWALWAASFPKRLTNFRKGYWRTLTNTIVDLILIIYSIWVMWSVMQFMNADSWAAQVLAGLSLATFTGVLAWYSFRISWIVRESNKVEGNSDVLYDDKETWLKYSLFYDGFKRGSWWVFMPQILYALVRGIALGVGDGHGLGQVSAQIVIEALMLAFYIWSQPFLTKAGNWINITIQSVKLLSIIVVLVFVNELGVDKTAQTVAGVALVAIQGVLTIALVILIIINVVILAINENPHRKRRKELEKQREIDNLTSLDPHNSILLGPSDKKELAFALDPYSHSPGYRRLPNPVQPWPPQESSEDLVHGAAAMGQGLEMEQDPRHPRSASRDDYEHDLSRQPTLPELEPRGYRR